MNGRTKGSATIVLLILSRVCETCTPFLSMERVNYVTVIRPSISQNMRKEVQQVITGMSKRSADTSMYTVTMLSCIMYLYTL